MKKKLRDLLPKGLEGKLIRFVVIFVLILGVVFQIISHFRVELVREAVIREEEKQIDLVQKEYESSMVQLTQESLLRLITWAADKTDDEFWILDHDLRALKTQVEDIFRNPENYERIRVYEPKKENRGKYALQILFPDGRENADPKTIEMMERLANLAPIMEEIIVGNDGYTYDVSISTPDGVMIIMDALSAMKFDENGEVVHYDATTRPWYKGAVEKGDVYFSPAIKSGLYNFREVCFSIPVYIDKELVAVINGSTYIEEISKTLNERNIGEKGFSILLSSDGQLVSSPKTAGELKMRDNLDEDIRETVNPLLMITFDKALLGKIGVGLCAVDEELYYVAYAPVPTVGWTQLSFVSTKELLAPTKQLLQDMDKSTENMINDLSYDLRKAAQITILILLVFLILAIMVVSYFAKKRVAPIQHMSESVKGFVGEDMVFEMEDIYRTGDEIEELASSFHAMSLKMKDYLNEIVTYTSDKERMETELKAAAQIQAKMLPQVEPDYCNRPEYELYAKMTPARDVGGDMYDFYYMDEDHLVLMIGDVSGKGITGALFMALGKQVLKSQMLLHGGDVVAALNEANVRLCEESDDCMFITIWLGIITLSTGVLNFVNGGHMYAAVKRGDKDFGIEEDIHGVLVGALDFAKYELNTVTLNKGDILYLYTDGVTEAQNEKDELFGEDRMIKALNEDGNASPEELDNCVRKRVAEFEGDMEQYDDMTTLCFKYRGLD